MAIAHVARRVLLGIAGATVCIACGPRDEGARPASADSKPLVAVIPKGTTHVFWKAVESGAKQAAGEFGIDVRWKGPLQENDRAQQIQLVQQFTAQHVAGIVLAPLDHAALAPGVAAARAAGIPVVIFDSALDGEAGKDFESFVATDNDAGGRMAGEELARLLDGKGGVVLLRYLAGSASTAAREAGFLAALAPHAGIEVLVDNRYAGPTIGDAKSSALNLVDDLKRARGVFAPNESSTNGLLLALRQAGLAGKVHFVGFDASPPLVEALKQGEIDALVVQDPRRMGYLAVETMSNALKHASIESRIGTAAVLVTRANMGDPAIARLLE